MVLFYFIFMRFSGRMGRRVYNSYRLKFLLIIFCLLAIGNSWAQVSVINASQAYKFEQFLARTLNQQTTSQSNLPRSIGADILHAPLQVPNPSAMMNSWLNVPSGPTSDMQRQSADEDIRQYEQQKKGQQALISEANRTLDEMHIEYEFPFEDLPEKKNYFIAFEEISKMLSGKTALDLERAVFLTESAYDPTISFSDFDGQLNKAVSIIGLKMQQDKLSPSDNLAKVMTTFKFMVDTLSVATKQETNITTYPKKYDFEDFWGHKDFKKMFVSKLLKEGSGQCHSLPLFFLLLCEKMNAEAHLAFAPNHSYIKFKDNRGKWHNIELTNGLLASDHFIIESGYIKAEALQNKIYMEALTKKQTIVQCLNDLALGYIKKFGYDSFVKACTGTAIDHHVHSLTAHQINANYFMTLDSYIRYQYKAKKISPSVYQQDDKAKSIYESAIGANKFIQNLGYADIPQDVYEAWLKSAQKEANRQQHAKEVKVLGGMMEIKK